MRSYNIFKGISNHSNNREHPEIYASGVALLNGGFKKQFLKSITNV